MNRQQVIDYYSRDDVVNNIMKNSQDREVAGAFWDGTYDKRPNMLQFPSDIKQMARKGITSFHFSVERWSNPMGLGRENYESLRVGWDLVIDMDSKIGIEGSKMCAEVIIELLERYGISNYGIKFSGSRGFHISLPWEMFPKEINYETLSKMYPEIPRVIVSFLRYKIAVEDSLMKKIMKKKSFRELTEMLGETPGDVDPFYFVQIKHSYLDQKMQENMPTKKDEISGRRIIDIEKGWGNRHMFRAPYSLNEKTWLVSLPIKKAQLSDFSMEMAKPEKVKPKESFFFGEENEATELLMDAMDWYSLQEKEKIKAPEKKKDTENTWQKIPEEAFPPCIKAILKGMNDGKKRSAFTLINFYRMMNYNWEEIESKITEWNEKNRPPLPRSILISQLRWNQQNAMKPANCGSESFYKNTGICTPDDICKKVKSPVSYSLKKLYASKPVTVHKKAKGKTAKVKGGIYKCSQCDRGFKSMDSLKIHLGRMHNG